MGINPCGVMDLFSYQLGNALLGNDLNAPAIEMHFPAAQILFEEPMIICLTGADFGAQVNGVDLPLHQPQMLPKQTLLQFKAWRSGARCYMAFAQPLALEPWLESYSTHLKAGAGGFHGRALQKDDVLRFRKPINLRHAITEVSMLPWSSGETIDYRADIQFLIGNEWSQLTCESQAELQNHYFQITADADRMGYRLAGSRLERNMQVDILSSGVSFGTVQLLPNGQLIILMADHQTTGGYPRVAQVISAHLPLLAQKKSNDVLKFVLTDLETAERKMAAQHRYLADLQLSCAYQMETLKM